MIRRRDFITLLGGAAAAWPLPAREQQAGLPVVAFVHGGSREMAAGRPDAFRKSLADRGYVEGQNVTVEYHWLDGRYDQLPLLMSDLVRRSVAVIVAANSTTSLANRKKQTDR